MPTAIETAAAELYHVMPAPRSRKVSEPWDRLRMALAEAPPSNAGRYRIRRCNDNTAAWILVGLRLDGTEIHVAGCVTTSMSVATLIDRLKPGCIVELIT